MNNGYIKLHEADNCAVVTDESIGIPFGHKTALCNIEKGEPVIKYGFPIGIATESIKAGEHIHSHNLKTALEGEQKYEYRPELFENKAADEVYFNGYKRSDGRVGIRNEIWIIPTVGCVKSVCTAIEKATADRACEACDGVFAFSHPYGCSQLGEDHENTKKILASLVQNGNAGGALIVSLGCENNNLSELMPLLDGFDKSRIRTLVCQDESDEIKKGTELVEELCTLVKSDKREPLPVSKLTVGLKCGGSDGLSGITANALCGRFTDWLTAHAGRVVLSEVPEMFGAEQTLLCRAENEEVFNSAVKMINGFKKYFISHGQPVGENPSPGNKAGGITTLEEKSLGCVQKGGRAVVTDVLSIGERCKKSGLSLLTGPGNDMVSCTLLSAAGANLILFTTGRGTPFGSTVPTLKISSNTRLYESKPDWIDFNAGELIATKSFDGELDRLTRLVLKVASGEVNTKNELGGFRDIAIFKDGVTL